MRPVSIARFEWAYLGSVLLWMLNLALLWDLLMETVAADPAINGDPQLMQFAQIALLAACSIPLMIWLALWYFIARRGSSVARWILVGLLICSAVSVPLALRDAMLVGWTSVVVTLMAFALFAYAVRAVFKTDARSWFFTAPKPGKGQPAK